MEDAGEGGVQIQERAHEPQNDDEISCQFAVEQKNSDVLSEAQKKETADSVSYTHLDVYKRQPSARIPIAGDGLSGGELYQSDSSGTDLSPF